MMKNESIISNRIPYFTIKDKKRQVSYRIKIKNNKIFCPDCIETCICSHLIEFVCSDTALMLVNMGSIITSDMVDDVQQR